MKKQILILITLFSLTFSFGQDNTTQVIIGSIVSYGNISSLNNNDTQSVSTLEIFFQDLGGDGLDTKITKLRLIPADSNTADWTDNIKGI